MSDQMPVAVYITKIVEETASIRTFYFDTPFPYRPGQFVMVWIPGIDEVPMALSHPDAITVQKVGDATSALFLMKTGDKIGIRGPFGNGFHLHGSVLAVAGGLGTAPLLQIASGWDTVEFLIGARTESDLLFTTQIKEECALHIATDDGSRGHHGYVVDLFDDLDITSYDTICVCGPELMMVSVLKRLESLGISSKGQFSLHRYMKCGVGICGSCCIDPLGLCVCRDGPVFSGTQLISSEFGQYSRDASGRKKVM